MKKEITAGNYCIPSENISEPNSAHILLTYIKNKVQVFDSKQVQEQTSTLTYKEI